MRVLESCEVPRYETLCCLAAAGLPCVLGGAPSGTMTPLIDELYYITMMTYVEWRVWRGRGCREVTLARRSVWVRLVRVLVVVIGCGSVAEVVSVSAVEAVVCSSIAAVWQAWVLRGSPLARSGCG